MFQWLSRRRISCWNASTSISPSQKPFICQWEQKQLNLWRCLIPNLIISHRGRGTVECSNMIIWWAGVWVSYLHVSWIGLEAAAEFWKEAAIVMATDKAAKLHGEEKKSCIKSEQQSDASLIMTSPRIVHSHMRNISLLRRNYGVTSSFKRQRTMKTATQRETT